MNLESCADCNDLDPVRIDLNIAAAYLDALDLGGLYTFQTFDDSEQKRQELVKVFHARNFLNIAPQLATLNEKGAGIFVTVNETDGKARRAESIQSVRAVFIDADGTPRPKIWHHTPDFLTWRDPLHWHAYWIVDDCPLEQFTETQKRLANLYGTDPKIHDLPRVMRVPGFLHCKSNPVLVHFERCK